MMNCGSIKLQIIYIKEVGNFVPKSLILLLFKATPGLSQKMRQGLLLLLLVVVVVVFLIYLFSSIIIIIIIIIIQSRINF